MKYSLRSLEMVLLAIACIIGVWMAILAVALVVLAVAVPLWNRYG